MAHGQEVVDELRSAIYAQFCSV